MRPQDILILLKMISSARRDLKNSELAAELGISASEVSQALERCRTSRLVDKTKRRVNTLALEEFLVHGLKYAYPATPQKVTRGMPTAVSAPPIKDHVANANEQFVWAYAQGTARGMAITPLYRTVPQAAASDETLYRLLAIADTLRIGRAREREIARIELKKTLDDYEAR